MTINGTNAKTTAASESGTEVFIPLNKLKKSPRNARKTAHSGAIIEAYAASIAAKGILQNLVVEPELDGEGAETGFYFVSIGEGRRLAQLLRVKRKQIRKTEPIRCVVDTVNDAHEISLDENITREAMHPADQFEAFRELHEERGWGAEEIAARFGISAHVVRQRLRLGAVSPKLMHVYREEGLTLDQLMAFAITDDHVRQEQVFESLMYNRDPYIIRRELTRTHVAANDRRAVFIGAEAYMEAGGAILRDLFTEDRGGFYEDAALLDRLVIEKLQGISETVRQAEGWKWADVHIDFPHANGLRRTYPQPVNLSDEDQAAFATASDEFNRLTEEWNSAEELPDDVDQSFGRLEAEIERIDALRHAFDPDVVSRGGVFVVLSHDGSARIERGFIRAEDELPEQEAVTLQGGEGYAVNDDGEIIEAGTGSDCDGGNEEEAEDDGKQLSDLLVRDLTAHRTLGLRLALGEQPDIALVAVTHALAAQTFYQGAEAHCLEIRPTSIHLAGHADGIEDTAAGKALADRHAEWAADMPRDVADLWGFIAPLDHASVLALFAHCASLTVNAVKQPWERKPRAHETADRLATAVNLDMTAHWTPTVRTYLGRITKAYILDAVREAASAEVADRLSDLKKQPMAEAAEQLLAGTGWLPAVLRTEQLAMSAEQQHEAGEDVRSADVSELDTKPAQPDMIEDAEAFNVAAE
ncbi:MULTISPECIES: ParB/Srx family N-terminal domain-containing protein [unclassified Mesorhizobium]|uniref:ParB/RepB/Spo0J family partition protein n=1 Tax=unclassified Mesorhizobium TaxID=325217 RepID=UPI0003CDDDFB|nr:MULTISPECIES: ParB/Srx family N-terminal domain-containing protein [unclassified Mesorhizobium]ESX29212.1 plasmid stablization protein ParB [Mesorhizobium sp. LSHC440B00]ESX37660.1 plasmid stablization protein ParB [Mesorhizobium sp. LSHC432A00]ESX43026.1 plasmid stablization protein ParB [Mesorhizobium sp. LSHC440A00]WJI57282.1 ParB/Srx family N-terminal domain-containing protein [Mesorhizobium sp. C432A]